jgi:hypothetical protein
MITFARLKAEVLRLAARNPDHVYRTDSGGSCFYNPNPAQGRTACIFGQAFINLGAPIPAHLEGEGIVLVLTLMCPDATDDDREWAMNVQIRQDGGFPWGAAVGAP